jgi:hypothetical protein
MLEQRALGGRVRLSQEIENEDETIGEGEGEGERDPIFVIPNTQINCSKKILEKLMCPDENPNRLGWDRSTCGRPFAGKL